MSKAMNLTVGGAILARDFVSASERAKTANGRAHLDGHEGLVSVHLPHMGIGGLSVLIQHVKKYRVLADRLTAKLDQLLDSNGNGELTCSELGTLLCVVTHRLDERTPQELDDLSVLASSFELVLTQHSVPNCPRCAGSGIEPPSFDGLIAATLDALDQRVGIASKTRLDLKCKDCDGRGTLWPT